MPRTIESIVECHTEATRRKAVGRPVWDVSVPLQGLMDRYKEFGDGLTAEQAQTMCQELHALLTSRIPAAWRETDHANYDMDFEDLMERLEGCDPSDFHYQDMGPVEICDDWLDELYDYGDRYRVWLK